MTTNPRDLIKRMADELDHYRRLLMGDGRETHALATEARALLSQPEPEGPTDEELLAAQDQAVASFPPIHPEAEPLSAVEYARELEIRKAQAILARWDLPAAEPVPVNDLVDLAHELRKTAEYLQGGCGWAKALDAIERAATLIESNALRLIAPIPASERPWERDGWCDNNGWCWGFDADDTDPYWSFDKPKDCPTWTHLLPHNALPLPVPTQHS